MSPVASSPRPARALRRIAVGLSLLCLGLPAAQAASISHSGIAEKISSADTFAAAGGNGAGIDGSESRLGSGLVFTDTITTIISDHNDDLGNSASAASIAFQTTTLTATSMSSNGQLAASVGVAFDGVARAEGLSSFETSFTVDADVSVIFGIGVSCALGDCLSSVSLFGPGGSTLVSRSTTSGVASGSFQGLLLAGQTYRIAASTHDLVFLTRPSPNETAGGSYSFQLTMMDGPGGMVPEPGSVALVAAGLGLLAWRARRGLQRSTDTSPS